MRANRPIVRLVYLLVLTALAVACARTVPVIDPEAPNSAARAEETFRLLEGTWDWARGDSTCQRDPHRLSFSTDRREMLLTYLRPDDSTGAPRVVRYQVLAQGKRVHPELPHVLRTAMEGETRKTPTGELVLWDIMLLSPNRYHWHRADWAEGGVTRALVRCDGTRPLEQWEAPAEP